jgi:hypothetical protein
MGARNHGKNWLTTSAQNFWWSVNRPHKEPKVNIDLATALAIAGVVLSAAQLAMIIAERF